MSKNLESKHVLMVDDDQVFLGAMSQILVQEGYRVTQATSAKNALEIIDAQEIHAVISDINMEGMNGIELFNYIKKIKPNIVLILMTGFAKLMETKEALDLGIKNFLAKPFKKEELLKTLHENLFPEDQGSKNLEPLDYTFCKLNIDDFVYGHEIKFDVYLRISESKYLKIAHQGEKIPLNRIEVFRSKKIEYLYIKKDDFKQYFKIAEAITHENINLQNEIVKLREQLRVLKESSDQGNKT